MTDYKKMTIPQLKETLGERSLKKTGKKAELIARLEHWDDTIGGVAIVDSKKKIQPYESLAKSKYSVGQLLAVAEGEGRYSFWVVVEIQSRKIVVRQTSTGQLHTMEYNYPFRLIV